MWSAVTSAFWLIQSCFSLKLSLSFVNSERHHRQKLQKRTITSCAAKTTEKAKVSTEDPAEVDQRANQNVSALPPPPPPLPPPHLRQASPLVGMIHKHKGPSSPARDTINLGLMSDAGEAAASTRAINNSPACVYTPSLTTGIQKAGCSRSKFDSFHVLHAGSKDV